MTNHTHSPKLLTLTVLVVSMLVGWPLLAQSDTDTAADAASEAGDPSQETSAAPETQVLAEIDVTASYSINRDEPVSTVALTREEILRLPHFGDDLYRALAVVPGVAGNDVSAQFNVRGGLYRDTALRIDGIELFEPYHLKDFQGVFSIIDPDVIGSVDLIPGGSLPRARMPWALSYSSAVAVPAS